MPVLFSALATDKNTVGLPQRRVLPTQQTLVSIAAQVAAGVITAIICNLLGL